MKLFLLALLSLILSVSTEDEIVADPAADQIPANSLYETLFSDYYNTQSYSNQKISSNKKSSKSKSSSNSKNQGISIQGGYGQESKGKQSNNNNNKKKSEYEEYNNYLKSYEGHKAEYDERLIGAKGLGFDKRTSTSYGFRAPLTPELLELNGYKDEKKENNKEIYPLIL